MGAGAGNGIFVLNQLSEATGNNVLAVILQPGEEPALEGGWR